MMNFKMLSPKIGYPLAFIGFLIYLCGDLLLILWGSEFRFITLIIQVFILIYLLSVGIDQIVKSIKNLRHLVHAVLFPTALLILGMMVLFKPFPQNLFVKYKEVWVYTGCISTGTSMDALDSRGKVKLTENGSFVIEWHRLFWGNYYGGTYTKSGDSLVLHYKGRTNDKVGTVLKYGGYGGLGSVNGSSSRWCGGASFKKE